MQKTQLRILVTDGEYKHAISLIKNIKKSYPNADIFAQVSASQLIKFIPSKRICTPIIGSFKQVIDGYNFDIIVPVSGSAVKLASTLSLNSILLSSQELVNQLLNKEYLGRIVADYGIHYPKTSIFNPQNKQNNDYPFIVKTADETQEKIETIYINNQTDLLNHQNELSRLHNKGVNLIKQQLIKGEARGYFAICNKGDIICEFMHQRVRQIPHTGGSSTAAKSINDEKLALLCRDFLTDIKWSGPIMLEFLYDPMYEHYYLIEINPKFWGSLDLAHQSGVDFGAALISTILQDGLYQKQNWKEKTVCWPLDGDIVTIVKSKKYAGISLYFNEQTKLIFGENIKSIIFKTLWSLKKIVTRK